MHQAWNIDAHFNLICERTINPSIIYSVVYELIIVKFFVNYILGLYIDVNYNLALKMPAR